LVPSPSVPSSGPKTWSLLFVERIEGGEERWQAIGTVDGKAVITVVHTYRAAGADEIVRIISARRANADERKQYVEVF
jgi:uncharacterized DUF497 family protein